MRSSFADPLHQTPSWPLCMAVWASGALSGVGVRSTDLRTTSSTIPRTTVRGEGGGGSVLGPATAIPAACNHPCCMQPSLLHATIPAACSISCCKLPAVTVVRKGDVHRSMMQAKAAGIVHGAVMLHSWSVGR